jgi:hypothetical protein
MWKKAKTFFFPGSFFLTPSVFLYFMIFTKKTEPLLLLRFLYYMCFFGCSVGVSGMSIGVSTGGF